MKMLRGLRLLLLSWVVAFGFCEKTLYTGHKVVRLTAEGPDAENLSSWLDSNQKEMDVWNAREEDQKKVFDVRVPQEHVPQFETEINNLNVEVTTLFDDLQSELDRQESAHSARRRKRSVHLALDEYHPIEEIYRYVDTLPQKYSNAMLVSLGRTINDRDIKGLYIGDGYNKAVIVECGIHAREWITPATCMYILNELLNNDSDPDTETLRDRYDWLVLPVFNPDGYSYTWTHDRMHRKNMAHYNPLTRCGGVDLNRNYDANFAGIGASTDPCSETYCGPSPFSERETSAERDLFKSLKGNITSFFSLHSYSQIWMIPYGYTGETPEDYDEMERVAKIGVDALEATHGTPFEYGTTYSAVYPTSGGNRDWAYKSMGIVYTYGLEMRDKGKYGFLLPEEQILDSAEETWNGIKAAVLAIPY